MNDTVDSQSTAPAATSAPAAGETSPATTTEQTSPPASADPAKAAPQAPTEDGQDDDESSNPKRPSRSQRLQRKVALLTAELDDVRRSAGDSARPERGAATAQSNDADQPPKEAEFNGDYLAFERALNAFNVKQAAREAVRSEAERSRTEQTQARNAEMHRERVLAHIERIEDIKERVPDFEETMKAVSDVRLRDEVVEEILSSEKSALIQYHLAKNPDKARDLNGLTGRELARAIGRLEGAVRLPAAKKATEASPPVLPLNGGTAPAFDPAKADMDDYAANYTARQAARQQRRA
jgi:hypothetical protein